MAQSEKILLGRIGAAHGIKGEVLVASFAEDPSNIAAYGPLSDRSGTRNYDLKVVRVTPKGVLVRIKGISDRTAAEALRGIELYVDRNKLPEPTDDEFYHSDLIGLTAINSDGTKIGTIIAIENYGAGDLVEIRLDGSTKTELIPFSDAFVKSIDTAAGHATIALPVYSPEDRPEDAQSETRDEPDKA